MEQPLKRPLRDTPTEKMLAWARRIAERLDISLPVEAETSFDACRDFLDGHAAIPPSERQRAYAARIARETGAELDDAVAADARRLSAWLDQHAPRH